MGLRMKRWIITVLCAPCLCVVFQAAHAQSNQTHLSSASGHVDETTVKALLKTPAFHDFLASFKLQGDGKIRLPFSEVPEGIGVLQDGESSSAPDLRACMSVTGSPKDGEDRDGIPLLYRQDFDCYGISNASGKSDIVGYYQVVDKDDTKYGVLGGFAFNFNIAFNEDWPKQKNQGALSGKIDVTPEGETFVFERAYSYEIGINSTEKPEISGYLKLQNQMATVYAPKNIAKPWASGSMKTSGYCGFTAAFYNSAAQSSQPLSFVFEVEMNVDYDLDKCGSSFFKNGSMQFVDGYGNVLAYNFKDCVPDVTFNGKSLEIASSDEMSSAD